jgi:Leucine-rich repeat (LRR) protein
MENITYLVLSDSGICEFPLSIGLLVELANLAIDRCKPLARIKKGKSQLQETMSSGVRSVVDFSFCYLSDEFLVALLPCFHCVTNLSLDYSSITILPSCINACHSLKELTLNNCTELQEIRDLPPNIKHLSAIN